MKTIKIKKLQLSNFRGQNHEFTFGDTNIIKGRNRSGKTTILAALLWLFTGYDEKDRKNFKLYDETAEFGHETATTAEVYAVVDANGEEITFRRTAQQKWVRKRGSEEVEKSNTDEYHTYIDGVELSATEYNKQVADYYADANTIRLILNQNYWVLIDWKTLRTHFESIIGEITEADYKGNYDEVKAEIAKYGAEQAKDMFHKLVNGKDKTHPGYKTQLADLKTSIGALETTFPDMAEVEAAEERLKGLLKQKQEIELKIYGYTQSYDEYMAAYNEKVNKLTQLQNEAISLEREYENTFIAAKKNAEFNIKMAEEKNKRVAALNASILQRYEQAQLQVSTIEADIETKYQQIKDLQQLAFNGYCPNCGAAYVGEDRAARLAQWKENQQVRYQLLVSEGKKLKEKLAAAQAELANIKAEESQYQYVDLSPLERELKATSLPHKPWSATDEAKECKQAIAALKDSICEPPKCPERDELVKEKQAIEDNILEAHAIAAQREVYDKTQRRIASMRREIEMVSEVLADAERKEALCEQYINEKADIIRYRVNRYFPDNIQVSMLKRRKDGKLEPTCDITIDGVSAQVCNHESAVKVGKAVSEAFQKALDISSPMFFDDADLLDDTNKPTTDSQAFYVYVANTNLTITNE